MRCENIAIGIRMMLLDDKVNACKNKKNKLFLVAAVGLGKIFGEGSICSPDISDRCGSEGLQIEFLACLIYIQICMFGKTNSVRIRFFVLFDIFHVRKIV